MEEVEKVSDSEGDDPADDDTPKEDLTIGIFPSHQGPTYLIMPNKQDKVRFSSDCIIKEGLHWNKVFEALKYEIISCIIFLLKFFASLEICVKVFYKMFFYRTHI